MAGYGMHGGMAGSGMPGMGMPGGHGGMPGMPLGMGGMSGQGVAYAGNPYGHASVMQSFGGTFRLHPHLIRR